MTMMCTATSTCICFYMCMKTALNLWEYPNMLEYKIITVNTDRSFGGLMLWKEFNKFFDFLFLQVLDAPSLQDDFYLNLVDWSSQNTLAVGLGTCVYLWNASTSKVL